ncbi:MAG: tetratricopeptide repeat protein [bacterium]
MRRSINVLVVVFMALLLLMLSCKSKETKRVSTPENIEAVEKEIRESYKVKVDKVREEIAKVQKERESKVKPLISEMQKQRELAINGYEEFISKYPESAYTPDILVRLGEAYYERAESEHITAIEEYQKSLEKADPNMSEFREEPKPHFENTIKSYQQIVINYPNFEYIDTAYYGLGYCLIAQEEYDEAAETLTTLIKKYPQSKYIPECYLRVGDYWFDKFEFDKAIDLYTKIDPASPFYDKGLYKIGWCYFNKASEFAQENYYKAVDSFCKLLDYYKEHEEITSLAQEAREFSSICFAELGDYSGSGGLLVAINYFNQNPKDYSSDILHELGNTYLYKQDKIPKAIEVYKAVLERDPTYHKAASVLNSVVEAYERANLPEDADRARQLIVDNYGPSSPWFESLKDPEDIYTAIEMRELNLYNVTLYAHSNAQKTNSREDYINAINRYKSYLYEFPGNPKSYQLNYFLAEALFAIGDYWNAGIEYERVFLEYRDARYGADDPEKMGFARADAAYNSVVAYSNVFDYERKNMKPPELKKLTPEIAPGGTGEGFEEKGPEGLETSPESIAGGGESGGSGVQ